MRDLSTIHELITDLFKWPKTPAEWDHYRLTTEQVAFFREYGYLADVKLLNEEQVERLKAELEQIMDPAHPSNGLYHEFHSNESSDPNKILFHALGAWRITPGFHDVLWNPAFVMAANQLLENKGVRFWHDQLFCKPAKHGGVVAWHQDYSYWTRTGPLQHLTCWVGLDDSTIENGCLYYVPKSHNWGLLDKPALAGDMDGLMQHLTPDQKSAFIPIPIELKAGHATFHHPLMVHGSHANSSPRSRRAFVTNVFADGTKSKSNDELLKGVPVIKAGHRMEGQFFPLLTPPGNTHQSAL